LYHARFRARNAGAVSRACTQMRAARQSDDGRAEALSSRTSDASADEQHAIERQENDGADDRHEVPRALVRSVPPQRLTDPSAEQRAGDAEQNRHDEPARIASRHDELGDRADNQPEDNPSNHAHGSTSARASLQVGRPSLALPPKGRGAESP